jgi:kynurenine formamidase
MKSSVPRVADFLRESPTNWGRWGPDDEVGALNFLTTREVLRGVAAIRQGQVFTLQIPINDPRGDPAWPGRTAARKFNTMDKGHYACGKGSQCPGGAEHADDVLIMHLQGSTQYDALGHFWCDDRLWNGFPASTTAGSMEKASVFPIADRGIVGRGVLIDIARHRGKKVLDKGETFSHADLLEAADRQGSPIEKHDILIVRTGWIGSFYERDRREFYAGFVEPGLKYSPELVDWFQKMEIPNLVTDTMANEVTVDPDTGIGLTLHIALMRNLGIAMTEMAQLDPLAEACAQDRQYTFLYTAAPLKVVGGSGAQANPLVIR